MKKPAVVLLVAFTLLGPSFRAGAADTAKVVKAVNLAAVNTAADEDEPFLSLSGQSMTFWFSRKAKDKYDILMIQRPNGLAAWSKPKLLNEFVRTEVDDRGAVTFPEGRFPQFLYYATRKDKDTDNFDIYVAVKDDAKADFAAPAPINRVDTQADEMHPWLTPNGKELWFSRKTKDGWRVFVANRADASAAQGFEEPDLIKELPPDFCHATLTRDGKTMYLQGPLAAGKKRLGLFVAWKTAKGWGEPQPLTMLNHPEGARGSCSPALSPGGETLYFASDRPDGKGGLDIWSVPTALLRVKK
jgi:hypothetical protein